MYFTSYTLLHFPLQCEGQTCYKSFSEIW